MSLLPSYSRHPQRRARQERAMERSRNKAFSYRVAHKLIADTPVHSDPAMREMSLKLMARYAQRAQAHETIAVNTARKLAAR